MTDLSQFATLGSQPIPGDSPTGASVRYEETFIALEAELSKLDNPAGGEINWRQSIQQCQEILERSSKDLLVAAWLVRSLHEVDGLPGLVSGLTVLRDLLFTHWEGLFPALPRVKARRAAIEWCSERCAGLLSPDTTTPLHGSDLSSARQVVGEIEAWAGVRFDGDDPGISSLRRRLDECLSAAGGMDEPAGETALDEGAGSSDEEPVMSQPAAAAKPRAAGGPPQTRAEAIQRLRELHSFFTKSEPHSPIGPLLARALAWTGKSFEEVFTEILGQQHEGRWRLYDQLGIPVPE